MSMSHDGLLFLAAVNTSVNHEKNYKFTNQIIFFMPLVLV